MKKPSYLKRIGIAIDQLVNTLFDGWPDETLSARCWREKRLFRYVIDYTIFVWQKDADGRRHCEQCYWYERERKDMPVEYRTNGAAENGTKASCASDILMTFVFAFVIYWLMKLMIYYTLHQIVYWFYGLCVQWD